MSVNVNCEFEAIEKRLSDAVAVAVQRLLLLLVLLLH